MNEMFEADLQRRNTIEKGATKELLEVYASFGDKIKHSRRIETFLVALPLLVQYLNVNCCLKIHFIHDIKVFKW